jgi:hypothetical protein
VPPPKSPHFTPTAPTVLTPTTPIPPIVLTPTTPIPAPIPRQTMVSLAWIEDPLRYREAMTPPSCVPPETLITTKIDPVFLHVS